eukprot:gnl/MRDRNA2_/MRDRNA2_95633_c0_seq1.p1 gnl/MRDRNA2_/MRDRNA2_95633_c0~~gnl/MRDRNA2_/MRDRNA2_95633_c0_seq1.p1  ORF type:complete len:252 (-),score=24.59 gnl/MRDRNA2_/MRDRNA2_95633_c0_seq1:454-1209(-)
MCSGNVFFPLFFVVQTHAGETSSDMLVDRLSNRRPIARSFHGVDLDKTTLAKSRSSALSSSSEEGGSSLIGACTSQDEKAIWALGGGTDDGSWPAVADGCAHTAATADFFLGISQVAYNNCLTGQVGISTRCSTCFAEAAQYAYDQCKFACVTSPWTNTCQQCVAGFDTDRCAGFELPTPTVTQDDQPKEDNVGTQTFPYLHILKDNVGMAHVISDHMIHIFAVLLLGLFVGIGFKSSSGKLSSWEGIMVL